MFVHVCVCRKTHAPGCLTKANVTAHCNEDSVIHVQPLTSKSNLFINGNILCLLGGKFIISEKRQCCGVMAHIPTQVKFH